MAFALPPIEYFNLFVTSIKDRSRIVDSLIACIDEYVDIESSYGKAMSKVREIDGSKSEFVLLGQGWESIYRFSLTSGKEYISLGSNLSQSIVRYITNPTHPILDSNL